MTCAVKPTATSSSDAGSGTDSDSFVTSTVLTFPEKPIRAQTQVREEINRILGQPLWGMVPRESQALAWAKTDEDKSKLTQLYKEVWTVPPTQPQGYKSAHWSEPNVLAHVRFDDRIDADGKRVLFIEEVQSDWHQAGR